MKTALRFKTPGRLALLLALLLGALAGQAQFTQRQKLTPLPDQRQAEARFGSSVAVDGNVMVVGAPTEEGVGAAYVFEQAGGTWQPVARLVANDRSAEDLFGYSVAVSGGTIVVGAWQDKEDASGNNPFYAAGSAYVFEKSGGIWQQTQKLVANDRASSDYFGHSVAVAGGMVVVGAPFESEDASGLTFAGSAYVFEKSGVGSWQQTQKLVVNDRASFDRFGWSVAISGSTLVVGATGEDQDAGGGTPLDNAGSAYVFVKDGGSWQQTQKLVANDRAEDDLFGESVAVSGGTIVVGAYWEDEDASGNNPVSSAGSAYVFEKSGVGSWQKTQKLVANDRASFDGLGHSVAVLGTTIVVGAFGEAQDASGGSPLPVAGSVYVFGPVVCDARVALYPSTPGRVCQGDSLAVSFATVGACPFPAPGTFSVQLSNAVGSFANPTNLGFALPGTTRLALPPGLPVGTGYRVRIVSGGQTSSASLPFRVEGPSLSMTPGVGSVPVCRGGVVALSFQLPAGSCPFPEGNQFTAQLSSATGSFNNPTNLGLVVPGMANSVTIPASVGTGTGYRVRVVSSSPQLTSQGSIPFRVNACASRLSAEEPALVVAPNPASGAEIRA